MVGRLTSTTPPHRPGVHAHDDGFEFTLFSRHATSVTLCLFGKEERPVPAQRVEGDLWTAWVSGARYGQQYGYRVDGPSGPRHRFDPDIVLTDPYARAITRGEDGSYRGVLTDPAFDWGSDSRPDISDDQLVIYECQVKGLTHTLPDVPPALRGTYRGLAHPAVLEHLTGIGVTAVELLPVHYRVSEPALADRGLSNYWGYNTLGYFAPDARFAAEPGREVVEFKSMVRALHEAGLQVLLDVVYNHTAEGDAAGPVLSFRGIDNASYYRHAADPPDQYDDLTGTGNTLDMTHPRIRQLMLDSLAYWSRDMHVDGFRFDLASALARDARDGFEAFFAAIRDHEDLREARLIAEPWDATPEGYRLGAFPPGWKEWNDRFRDTTRRFWRGDEGQRADMATALTGSRDLFEKRHPGGSINYVTCHDGFTLRDLVSYEDKHNEANGEQNRDGSSANWSANWGAEGPVEDETINRVRRQIRKNMLATLLVSQGIPMLNHGDELGRTQRGNNNAYCQDNDISWMDYGARGGQDDLTKFVAGLITLRNQRRLHSVAADGARITWHDQSGAELNADAWEQAGERFLGMLIRRDGALATLLLMNPADEPAVVTPPPAAAGPGWNLVLDTTEGLAGKAEHGWTVPAHALLILSD